jgi:hypothetical protein
MSGLFEKLGDGAAIGKIKGFRPQAVGDATVTPFPGGVTGSVAITRYNFQPQAAEDERETLQYPSGKVTGQIPINPKELMVFHNVV